MARYEPRDRFYERAHEAGYRSRAVFKLQDLLKRAGGLRRGARVLELGAWPGGWLQILAEAVGPQGHVVGIDLRAIDPIEGVHVLELDMTEPQSLEPIRAALEGRPADAVLSDAAPTLTGIRDVDRAAAEEIYEATLRIIGELLRPGGFLIAKGFPGPGADALRKELRRAFERVTEVRPEGKRKTSQEFYWLALGHRPQPG
jgi:23S rRNA (uridine2552-2'-O)-methyltransferase